MNGRVATLHCRIVSAILSTPLICFSLLFPSLIPFHPLFIFPDSLRGREGERDEREREREADLQTAALVLCYGPLRTLHTIYFFTDSQENLCSGRTSGGN